MLLYELLIGKVSSIDPFDLHALALMATLFVATSYKVMLFVY